MNAQIESDEISAKAAHEERQKIVLSAPQFVITFAIETIKSAILVNGGTAAALLAFVGQKGIQAQPGLGEAFYWFAGGLLCGALASGFSYLAQLFYTLAIRSYRAIQHPPYIQNLSQVKWWKRLGITFHLFGIVAVAMSFGAACRGFWVAGRSLPF